MAGSGLAIPTAAESTTTAMGTPRPGPTWQVASAARRRSSVPFEFDTRARATPVPDSAHSASIDPGATRLHMPGAAKAASSWATASARRSGSAPASTAYASSYAVQKPSSPDGHGTRAATPA